MPPHAPGSSPHRRGGFALRGVGFAAAVVLGGVAIWLIVTSTQQKRIEIGVLLGLWGLLLGAFSVFGSRSHARDTAAPTAPPAQSAGTQLDLRQVGEIERAAVVNAVAAARREFQAELEHMLRREVQAGLAQEVAGLRAEVSALRNDLVEKVGGQLRLERIETTRLIGSDLEALQQELRQLREIGGSLAAETMTTHQRGADDVHEAEIVVERVVPPQRVVVAHPADPTPTPPRAEPERRSDPARQQPVTPQPVAQQPVAQQPEPASEPEPQAAPAQQPEPTPLQAEREPEPSGEPAPEPQRASSDPFASMPRIRPFTDFELDPTPATPPRNGDAGARSGRHVDEDSDSSGGRRHRADDDGNDMLARILARESHS